MTTHEDTGSSQSVNGTESLTVTAATADSNSHSKINMWESLDVVEWLENKDLHIFIPLFQKHCVTGKDLVQLNLAFLDSSESISLEDREKLLSEIYQLLNPATVHASEEDLTRISSPTDKHKYYAAIELAQAKCASLPRSCSVFTLPSQHAVVKSSSLSRASPVTKPRHKSESGIERYSKTARFDTQEYTKKRKIVPKMKSMTRPVYDSLQWFGPQCIQCITLTQELYKDVGMNIDTVGHVTVGGVPDSLSDRLHVGDRILEINGHVVHVHPTKDVKSHLASMLQLRSPAKLVLLTEHCKVDGSGYEEKWRKLQSMLVEMRDSDTCGTNDKCAQVSPVQPHTSPTSPVQPHTSTADYQQQLLHHTALMQKEIQALKEKVEDQERENEELHNELEDRDAIMHDLELSRDKAIEKLRQNRSTNKSSGSRESIGGAEYFNMTINSLNLEEKSKEEVVESLKEIVMEASKQKWYLDRLISLVIEESPWLLDEVDSEFDHLTLSDKSEEYC